MTLCSECPKYLQSHAIIETPHPLCAGHVLEAAKKSADPLIAALLTHLQDECEDLRRKLDDHIDNGWHRNE
jgi:hypothetical protein